MAVTRETVEGGTQLEEQLGTAQAVRAGQHIFVSGQMALDDTGAALYENDLAAQFKEALTNVGRVLERAGASLDDVVATHMFLTEFPDEQGFVAICNAHRESFAGKNRPTGTMVYVPRLPVRGAMVEITAVAVVD